MFTGIIEELGRVVSVERGDDHARLRIACTEVVRDVAVGDSISVDGCCLTVTEHATTGFAADLMAETMRVTALGDLAVDAPVNLERAMHAQQRFGGHLVQGHVDGVGRVTARVESPGTVFLSVRAPSEVSAYLVAKGSVTMAGVSLTVVDVDDGVFRVGVIPHTLEVTTLGGLGVGDRVNLEADVIAKYVEHLLAGGAQTPYAAAGPPDDDTARGHAPPAPPRAAAAPRDEATRPVASTAPDREERA